MRIFLPRRSACSSTATRRPRLPASMAHIRPAAPPPRMSASKEWVIFQLRIVINSSFPQGLKPTFIVELYAALKRRSCTLPLASVKRLHIKQAQARQVVFFQKALVDVLFLE